MGTSNPDPRACRVCGARVPHDAPFGHCPGCLIDLGFGPLPDDPPAFTAPISGRAGRFGEYELLEQIGRGGMGVVYKARQVSLKRLVALKMLGPHASAFPGIAERLRLEAETAGSLSHPNIVTIFDVGELDGQPFFTMELIEGSGLDKFIGREGFRLKADPREAHDRRNAEEAEIARLMIEIARAVDHAHKFGVLHRDLKPANILIDASGAPHLTDFGLAKVLGRVATTATASGAIMGTPTYMAPEQAAGGAKHASTAADVYSLGAILYEMLTGHPPFRGETPLETLRRVVEEQPKPPSTLNRNLDGDLAIICLKCLEKNPTHRYGSAEAVADDLERWLRGEPIHGRAVRRLERAWRWCRREPVLAGLVGGLFFLLTAVTVLSLSLYRKSDVELEQVQIGKVREKQALLDRIESEWMKPQTSDVRILATELASLADQSLVIDGKETEITIGFISRLRKPDEAIQTIVPLINYLQTNLAVTTTPQLLFNLRIFKNRSAATNALVNTIDAKLDVLKVDPADYIALRARNANIVPLVKQSYRGQPGGVTDLRAVVFTRTDSALKQLGQLKGKSIAFGERGSALGEHLPSAALVRSGLRFRDLSKVTYLGSGSTIEAVRNHSFDAGVAEWDDFSNATNLAARLNLDVNLTILQELSCPNHPWLASPKLDSKSAASVAKSLLSLSNATVPLPFDPKLIGFDPILPGDYDALERDMQTALEFMR